MPSEPSGLERAIARTFGDAAPTTFGTGWMSGTVAVFLGAIAVAGTLAFRYPGLLTTAEFRACYSVGALRALLEVAIGLAFLFGATSMMLRPRKVLGLTAFGLVFASWLLGGPQVDAHGPPAVPFTIGLDWFVPNVLLMAAVFVPIERVFPHRPDQGTCRFGWVTDGVHFLVSHLAVQVLSFLTLLPATSLAALWQPVRVQAAVAAPRRRPSDRTSANPGLLVVV